MSKKFHFKPSRDRRIKGLIIITLIILICTTPQFRYLATFPDHIRISQGGLHRFHFQMPLQISVKVDEGGVLNLNGETLTDGKWKVFASQSLALKALRIGEFEVQLKLFGIIPFKKLEVEVLPEITLMPGGQSIGVLLHAEGVLVIDHAEVVGRDSRYSPAKEAGIKRGDVLVAINGISVKSKKHASQLIHQFGKRERKMTVTVKRGGRTLDIEVPAVYDIQREVYLIGLWIKDSAAGVGTLTFYDAETRKYAALGHVIADARSEEPILVKDGKIVEANIVGVDKGKKGEPGEKIGQFSDSSAELGSIEDNGPFGIVGQLAREPDNPLFEKPLPVALASHVEPGPAEIITVVDGKTPKAYEAKIERVINQRTPSAKGMVVKVTDAALLEATGGIVQGMSGSPIVQEGRLVGAITHVFVNDPRRGYGVFAEWMVEQAEFYQKTGLLRSQEPAA